ncbi:MAG: spore protease YyaC [bacterium]|jgi:putative sporulation protein YyaC
MPTFFFPAPNPIKQNDWEQEFRINIYDQMAIQKLTFVLSWHFRQLLGTRPLVVLCIGTDRSTGDSLGPLIGTRLMELRPPMATVLGTLEEPVHAANLQVYLTRIKENPQNPLVLALDACLGRKENIGTITIARGPLKPGAGVKKELPPVGQLHITGIVNVGGFMEYFVLQNTRLSIVHRMAMNIADVIHHSLLNFQKETGAI